MPDFIIVDTSVLIIFDNIGRLDILNSVYGEIYITPEIEEEFGKPLPEWIKIKSVRDKKYQNFLEIQLDAGEASAIALSVEIENSLVILDDLRSRKTAKQLRTKFSGTLGVVNKAKELGIIDKVKPVVENFIEAGFRLSDEVINDFLSKNEEE